jgi:hypothetical protein
MTVGLSSSQVFFSPSRQRRCPASRWRQRAVEKAWFLWDSRVVDVSMAYNPTFVTLSSL